MLQGEASSEQGLSFNEHGEPESSEHGEVPLSSITNCDSATGSGKR